MPQIFQNDARQLEVGRCVCVSCGKLHIKRRQQTQRLPATFATVNAISRGPAPRPQSPAVRDNSSGNGSANVKSRRQQQKFNKMETIKCTELQTPEMVHQGLRFLAHLFWPLALAVTN